MELNPKDVKAGMTWLFVAGGAAIALSIFLQYADYSLSTSDREVRLRDTLLELRTAQAEVGSDTIDRRLDVALPSEYPSAVLGGVVDTMLVSDELRDGDASGHEDEADHHEEGSGDSHDVDSADQQIEH